MTSPANSKLAVMPLKSNRVPTSRLAWSTALRTSCRSTSETTSKDGIDLLSPSRLLKAGYIRARLAAMPVLAPRMVLGVELLEPLPGDVGIDLGGGEVAVAEQHLHYPQVGAVIEQMGGEGVTQGVG